MIYSISWRPVAQAQLTRIWLAARDRERISDAIGRLEEALRRDPHQVGESRESSERIVFIETLSVKFFVDEPRLSVQVFNIRRIR